MDLRELGKNRDSSVGIAVGYGLDDRNVSGAHPASYPEGTRGCFPGSKAAGVKLTSHLHLLPRSRMRGAIPPLPRYVFMVWCLVKHRDNFIFTFGN
jgi:hypothetical protein